MSGEEIEIEVPISYFDVSQIKPDRLILIVGRRGAGKSTVLKDLLTHLCSNFDAGCAMSPTPDSLDMFRQFLPDSCIYENFDGDKIVQIVQFMKALGDKHIHRKVFVILDDCMFDSKVMKSIPMRNIHMNGRHLHITFINIVQYTMDIPKALRMQIDYVFALREPQLDNRKNLYNNFFGIFPSFESFCAALDEFTKDNRCLVVDNTSKANEIAENVFWYKANPPDASQWLKLGGRHYWKMHHMFYKRPKDEPLGLPPIPALMKSSSASNGHDDGGIQVQAVPTGPVTKKVPKTAGRRGKGAERMVFKPRGVNGSIIIELPANQPTGAAKPAPAAPARVPADGQRDGERGAEGRKSTSHHHARATEDLDGEESTERGRFGSGRRSEGALLHSQAEGRGVPTRSR